MQSAHDDVQAYGAGLSETSLGWRAEFWQNTLRMIRQHPVLGGGTGSFASEYREQAAKQRLPSDHATVNPHNEYLLVWSQQGLVGLALLLVLWVVQWRRALALNDAERYLTHALVLIMICGDLFNSFLLDNFEGHFYAVLTAALAVNWPRSSALQKTHGT